MMTARAGKLFLTVALGAALLFTTGPAAATIVTWHLQNVRFDDGATATGVFVYDTEKPPRSGFPDLLVGFDVKVSGGPPGTHFPSFEYTPASTFLPTGTRDILALHTRSSIPGVQFGRTLQLDFAQSLPDRGGRVSLVFADCDVCPSLELDEGTFAFARLVTSGEVTTAAVPEPSEALLLAFGLAALVGFSARRRH
jgi:hypothetical protein